MRFVFSHFSVDIPEIFDHRRGQSLAWINFSLTDFYKKCNVFSSKEKEVAICDSYSIALFNKYLNTKLKSVIEK